MNTQKSEISFELVPRLVCKKCGRESKPDGNYIHHKSGTVSFQIYNADKECVWCKIEANPEKYGYAKKIEA